MKQIISLAIIMLMSFSSVFAKDKERASKHTTVKNNLVSVTYGQPMKKGRVIFGEGGLVPYDQIWRTGADEATEITFAKNCKFGDLQVKAGTYTLFTKPYKGEWLIILNKKLGQWGAYDYEKNKDQNVGQTSALIETLKAPVETFTIATEKDGVRFSWDMTSVKVPVTEL